MNGFEKKFLGNCISTQGRSHSILEFLRARVRAQQAYKLKNVFNTVMQNPMNGFGKKFVGNVYRANDDFLKF